jgi:hypothetical protein
LAIAFTRGGITLSDIRVQELTPQVIVDPSPNTDEDFREKIEISLGLPLAGK